jgi:hypothetical protein
MAINYMCKASEHDMPTEPVDPEARLTAMLWHKDQRIAALERELAELKAFYYRDSSARVPPEPPQEQK